MRTTTLYASAGVTIPQRGNRTARHDRVTVRRHLARDLRQQMAAL